MQSREPGRSGLNISMRGLGTVNCKEQTTEAGLWQLGAALEASMNFVDAAEMYAVPARVGTVRPEELYIGSWFQEDGIGLADSFFVRSPALPWGQAPPSYSNCSTAIASVQGSPAWKRSTLQRMERVAMNRCCFLMQNDAAP
ncbi:aldo/keto reductase protein (plasmid) [Rhizobium etli]|uniref:Aldo/keto reductase protein n=1 Tax=Rhizobium etli TaxID=29449 RepID=A0AAN1BLC7_RHIET|nr:hypothetical protein [Rhizobium etli]ARQ13385.1 aldo/keto reductase protein [Rhizobium etli]